MGGRVLPNEKFWVRPALGIVITGGEGGRINSGAVLPPLGKIVETTGKFCCVWKWGQ